MTVIGRGKMQIADTVSEKRLLQTMEHESNRKSVFKNDCKTELNAKVAFRRKMREPRENLRSLFKLHG